MQAEVLEREKTLSFKSTRVYKSVQVEQVEYQQDVFRALLKWVAAVCALFTGVYFVTFVQQGSWAALVIGLNFGVITGFSLTALRILTPQNFTLCVRIWLALAMSTIYSFGFLQGDEFINITALGGSIVIVLSVFLESARTSIQWAIVNIGAYLLNIILRSFVVVPAFDLGVLRPIVLYGAPIAVLIILTAIGRVTTQHFKDSLLRSESRRKQLEIQGRQLRELAEQADAARKKAEQADHIKSAFLASMSHELRTPLNSVINFTRFVADGDTGEINEEQKELLDEVIDSAHHLLNLINDVLDISKIEAGGLNLFIEDDIDLNPIVKNVVTVGRSLIAEKPVTLETEFDEDVTPIRGDRQRILQILLNIMSNACKFTDEGKIIVRVRREQDQVVITIADTGPGIPLDEQQKVFEAFKQTQVGMRRGNGTGLGMPIARSLTEAHGGKLWLHSEPGKGATFYVSLPIKSDSLVPTLA